MKKSWKIHVDDKKDYTIDTQNGQWSVDGNLQPWDLFPLDADRLSLIHENRSLEVELVRMDRQTKELQVRIQGRTYTVRIQDAMDQLLSRLGMDTSALAPSEPLKAPMPGKLLKIMVTPGQEIKKGDGLVVLEAMKMENVLKATGPGTIKSIPVEENMAVEKGAVLVTFE